MGDDLAFALHLADLAATVTLPSFGRRLPVTFKSDDSPVTEVDSAAERAIRTEIAATYPGDAVLGEEGGQSAGTSGRTWVIDPIDGTKMFAEGIPLWTTLIGLKDGEGLVAAVADAPALGERYSAARGGGAYRNGQQIHVSDVAALGDAFVVHAPLEDFMEGTGVAAISRVVSAAKGSRGIADAWAHLLVARGAVDVLIEQGQCFEWDWAATSLIVQEAGGQLSRLEGGPPTPGCHLLVSNARFDDQTRAALYAEHAPHAHT